MKKIIIFIIILIIITIIAVLGIIFYFNDKLTDITPKKKEIETVSLEKNKNIYEQIVPFTNEELSYLNGLEKEPAVKEIRNSINRYSNGQGDDNEAINEMENCGYDKFPDYISGKFTPFQVGKNTYGGVNIKLIFIDKPDKVFTAWVYDLAGGGFELRSFCDDEYSSDKIKVIYKAFFNLFADKSRSI